MLRYLQELKSSPQEPGPVGWCAFCSAKLSCCCGGCGHCSDPGNGRCSLKHGLGLGSAWSFNSLDGPSHFDNGGNVFEHGQPPDCSDEHLPWQFTIEEVRTAPGRRGKADQGDVPVDGGSGGGSALCAGDCEQGEEQESKEEQGEE